MKNVRLPAVVRAAFVQLKTKFDMDDEDGVIRFISKDSQFWNYCPVTAICQMLTGKKYFIDETDLAGKAIGLSKNAINTIVIGADTAVGKERDWLEGLLSGKSTRKHT